MQAFPFLDHLLPSQDWAGWVLPGIKWWHPTVGPTASTTVRQFLVHLPAPGVSNCRSRKKALYKVWLTYENIPLFLQYTQSHLARSPDLHTYKVKIATKTMKAFGVFFFFSIMEMLGYFSLESWKFFSISLFFPSFLPPPLLSKNVKILIMKEHHTGKIWCYSWCSQFCMPASRPVQVRARLTQPC